MWTAVSSGAKIILVQPKHSRHYGPCQTSGYKGYGVTADETWRGSVEAENTSLRATQYQPSPLVLHSAAPTRLNRARRQTRAMVRPDWNVCRGVEW